ncbi:unnamed protein product [Arctogadus glacialis]
MEQCNWKDVPLSQTRVPQGPGQSGDPAEDGGSADVDGILILILAVRAGKRTSEGRQRIPASVEEDTSPPRVRAE